MLKTQKTEMLKIGVIHIPDIQDHMEGQLTSFLSPITPDKEPSFEEFAIQCLTVWPGRKFLKNSMAVKLDITG